MLECLHIEIPDGTPRTRLEDFLFDRFPNLSRMYLRDVVRSSKCEVNGRIENVGFRVRGGDFIEIELDTSRETAMRGEDISLDIVYEDAHLIVVNKPAGMLVHPTHREKTGTLLNALVHYLNAERLSNAEYGTRSAEVGDTDDGESAASPISQDRDYGNSACIPHPALERRATFIRPGLVHRLDKETSGLMVVAKSVDIHRRLARQFQRKQVEKRYVALIEGVMKPDNGVIEDSIGRYAEEKLWAVKEGGKHSVTRFVVRERRLDTTLLELEPVTGRTNQLRIHCAAIGHPIVGDVSRGGRVFDRLCLHATRLAFTHPSTRCPVEFESPPPKLMMTV